MACVALIIHQNDVWQGQIDQLLNWLPTSVETECLTQNASDCAVRGLSAETMHVDLPKCSQAPSVQVYSSQTFAVHQKARHLHENFALRDWQRVCSALQQSFAAV